MSEKELSIKVLGPAPGDINRTTLLSRTKEALKELHRKENVEVIGYLEDIKKYRALALPALVINEKVAASGRPVPSKEKIKSLIKKTIEVVSEQQGEA